MLAVAVTLFMSGLLITGACMPMVHRKLPMNAWYGMRTTKTFQSEEAWLHLNEIGGMLFSLLGFPLMLGGTIGFFLGDEYVALIGLTSSVACVASIGMALYMFVRYANRYSAANAEFRA